MWKATNFLVVIALVFQAALSSLLQEEAESYQMAFWHLGERRLAWEAIFPVHRGSICCCHNPGINHLWYSFTWVQSCMFHTDTQLPPRTSLHSITGHLGCSMSTCAVVILPWYMIGWVIPVSLNNYCDLPKIGPPLKISPPPFFNEVVAKGAFLSDLHPQSSC